MEPVKTVKMGANLVITGTDKAAVEAAAQAVAARGGKILSNAQSMGSKWVITCEDADESSKECQVVKLGLQVMIKGPTEQVVRIKAQQMVREGAKLISAPSEATGGGWVAVCDEAEQGRVGGEG